MGTIEIRKSKDNQYYFIKIAGNGEIIESSETYTSKQNCKKGIRISRIIAIFARIKDTTL